MPNKVAHCDFPASKYRQSIRHLSLPPPHHRTLSCFTVYGLVLFVVTNKALTFPNALLNFTPRPTLSMSMRESFIPGDAIFISLVAPIKASSYLYPFTRQHPKPMPSLSLHSSPQLLHCAFLDRDATFH